MPAAARRRNELVVPSDSTDLADRQYFYFSDGATTVRFEFDPANNGVNSGSVAIPQPWRRRICRRTQQIVNCDQLLRRPPTV